MYNHLYISVVAPLEFILSLARISKVRLKKVAKLDKGCSFYISNKDFIIFQEILNKHDKEYCILKNYAIKTFMLRNLIRYGFYAGILISAVVLFFYSANMTRLKISGNKLVQTQEIYQVVTSKVQLPCAKGKIDRLNIIKDIVAIEGISNASVKLVGNTIIVEVYEELEKVEITDPNDYSEITSKYDALITRIVTYSGGAVAKKGQAVRKGDRLIASEIELDDGVIVKEKALGDVYGRVWFSKSLVLPPTIMINKRSGNIETYNYTFFTKNTEYKGSFTDYEWEKQSYLLPCILPFFIHKYTYYQTVPTEIEWDYASNKDGVIKENTQLLEQTLPDGAIKLRTWYVEKIVDKTVYLDIYYEVEMKIN